MKNNKMDAMLRRDDTVQLGLEADKALYAPLEEDIAPLRTQHAAGLEEAKELADEVFAADGDESATVKRSTRGQLRSYVQRMGKALVAHADSAANTDEDLEERITKALRELPNADSATFAQAAEKLLAEATPLAPKLVKREITAQDFTEANRLLLKYQKRLPTGRAADVQGKTAREKLGIRLQANAVLVKRLRKQLAPYKGTARERALANFDGNAKVVVFRNGSGGKGSDQPTL